MSDVSGCVLQLTDGVSGRRFALRVDPDHAGWTLRRLLERYLRDCPLEELLAARRITPRSAEDLRAVQDYVYTVSDEGALQDVYRGVVFRQGGAPVGLDDSPVATTVRVRGRRRLEVDGLVRESLRYPPACMTTRPPSRTWMLRSCLSSNNIPTSGVVSASSTSTTLGEPSQSTVAS